MIAISLGAFSVGGFSTIPVSRNSRGPSCWPRRFRTWKPPHAATATAPPRIRRAPRPLHQLAQAGRRQSKISSGRSTANGSLPTASWPEARHGRYPVARAAPPCNVRQPRGAAHDFEQVDACRAAQGNSPAQARVAKWSSKAPLPRLITITISRNSGRNDFLDDKLDGGRIDDRQQFLGHHLGCRQHPGAITGGQNDGFIYLHGMLVIPGECFGQG